MSKVVVIDIDEVLQPFFEPFYKFHDEKYGTKISGMESNGRYFVQQFTGESSESGERKLEEYIQTPDFAGAAPLIGAVEAIERLRERGYDLVIVTSRPPFFAEATHLFLDKHFPKAFSGVHFIEHFPGSVLKPAGSKLKICQQVGADYIIDDNTSTAVTCAEAGMQAVLFGEYGWNKHENLPAGVTRCKDWAAVKEYFDAL